MIDYCLKEVTYISTIPLNIENININSENILLDGQEKQIFKVGYKYPYICSEILSSEFTFIIEKFFPLPETNLEESKSYFLNLSTDSINLTPNKKEVVVDMIDAVDEGGMNIVIDEIVKKDSLLFNPPEIEYGYDKEKEKEKEKEMISFKTSEKLNIIEKDNSLNTSLDRKLTMNMLESLDLLDYLFSFINSNSSNPNFPNPLNSISASYFCKIICSFIKTKSSNLIKYICQKKNEILINLINNVNLKPIADIICKVLLIDNLSLEESLNFDIVKLSIFNRLLLTLSNSRHFEDITNISYLLQEYLESSKNIEILLTETFLNNLSQQLLFSRNKASIKEIIIISTHLLKQFRAEYEKAQKFVSSISLKSKVLEKTNILNLENDILIIWKLSNSVDNILDLFNSLDYGYKMINILRLTIFEFIYNLLTLTRTNQLLEKLNKYKFFQNMWKIFFNVVDNDIYMNLCENIVNVILEDCLNNTLVTNQFFNSMVIRSNLITDIIKYCVQDEVYITLK
jgi:hypothetical protein